MKFSLDIKNKKGSLDADVEKIVEKGMELHEHDWKEKFDTKHQARKEIMEIQHQQKMEMEENNKTKKNWVQKIIEENRKTKELELEEKRRQEEAERLERERILKTKKRASIILGIITIVLLVTGFLMGSASGNSNSGWYAIACIGFFTGCSIIFIWSSGNDTQKNRK